MPREILKYGLTRGQYAGDGESSYVAVPEGQVRRILERYAKGDLTPAPDTPAPGAEFVREDYDKKTSDRALAVCEAKAERGEPVDYEEELEKVCNQEKYGKGNPVSRQDQAIRGGRLSPAELQQIVDALEQLDWVQAAKAAAQTAKGSNATVPSPLPTAQPQEPPQNPQPHRPAQATPPAAPQSPRQPGDVQRYPELQRTYSRDADGAMRYVMDHDYAVEYEAACEAVGHLPELDLAAVYAPQLAGHAVDGMMAFDPALPTTQPYQVGSQGRWAQ